MTICVCVVSESESISGIPLSGETNGRDKNIRTIGTIRIASKLVHGNEVAKSDVWTDE